MKIKKTAVILFYALFAVACSKKEPSSDMLPVRIYAEITSSPDVKSQTSTNGKSVFSNGDSIGLFASYNNNGNTVKWTFDKASNKWFPEAAMYWKDKESIHLFAAYSPYVKYDGGNTSYHIPMPALAEQDGDDNLYKYDFLYSERIGSYGTVTTNGVINFNMAHESSLLILNISGNTNSVGGAYSSFTLENPGISTLSGFSITGNPGKQVIFDDTPINIITVTPGQPAVLSSTPATYFVITNPKMSADANPVNTVFTISYSIGAVQYVSTGILPDNFEAGKMYQYNITVKTNSIDVGQVTISDWLPGDVSGGGNITTE